MVNTGILPPRSAPRETPFQADDEGSIPFTRSNAFNCLTSAGRDQVDKISQRKWTNVSALISHPANA
jgi:hypothetical protein